MFRIIAQRYHDICCGHRVVGHEGKCKHLHGHNYRFEFQLEAANGLDKVGRVMDFSIIKSTLCQWLEDNWDHKMLIWEKDPMLPALKEIDSKGIWIVEFNPTAENIAEYFVENIAPRILQNTNCELTRLKIEETRKCSVIYVKR